MYLIQYNTEDFTKIKITRFKTVDFAENALSRLNGKWAGQVVSDQMDCEKLSNNIALAVYNTLEGKTTKKFSSRMDKGRQVFATVEKNAVASEDEPTMKTLPEKSRKASDLLMTGDKPKKATGKRGRKPLSGKLLDHGFDGALAKVGKQRFLKNSNRSKVYLIIQSQASPSVETVVDEAVKSLKLSEAIIRGCINKLISDGFLTVEEK